jgi:hypothetical protein
VYAVAVIGANRKDSGEGLYIGILDRYCIGGGGSLMKF